jgi:hypothetical protein
MAPYYAWLGGGGAVYRITKEEITHREVGQTGFLIVVFNAVIENASHRKKNKGKKATLCLLSYHLALPLFPLC